MGVEGGAGRWGGGVRLEDGDMGGMEDGGLYNTCRSNI